MFTLVFILFLLTLLGLVFGAFIFKIVTQSIRREGDLGINFHHPICPNCGVKTDLIRLPNTKHPIPWGGGVCAICGCEMDKWGNELTTESANIKQLPDNQTRFTSDFTESGKTRLEKVFEEDNQ
jgi:hypothetical protein